MRGLVFFCALSGCLNLELPPEPEPVRNPVITGFAPRAAYTGDRIVVYGENFAPTGNQLLFAGGLSSFAAQTGDGVDEREDGGVVFYVPFAVATTEPLVLAGENGQSAPSADCFVPLGTGHPSLGNQVASLRFRHAPVGLTTRYENVLVASGTFDLVLTDGKAYQRMPGRPLALTAGPRADRALVSVLTGGGGKLVEVSDLNGEVCFASQERPTRDRFILPPDDAGTLARTIGSDARGNYVLTVWAADGGSDCGADGGEEVGELVAISEQPLPFSDVLGAASNGELLVVVARGQTVSDATPAVYTVSDDVTPVWNPLDNSDCEEEPDETICQLPEGPIALVPKPDGGVETAVALTSGDLAVLAPGTFDARDILLISYAPIDAMRPGLYDDRVLFTKSRDGALFQYDLGIDDLDWSVQLRGEPTAIALAPDIEEIAVANRADNSVDTVNAATGVWSGRIALDLGLGSAPGHPGGIAAPFTYDHEGCFAPPDFEDDLLVLMRNIGLVLRLNASSLEVKGHTVLDAEAAEALRLAVTPSFETLVIHRNAIGVVEDEYERIVTTFNTGVPRNVFVTPGGEVVLATIGALRVLQWNAATPRMLTQRAELVMPPGVTLVSATALEDGVLMLTVSGGSYRLAQVTLDGDEVAELELDPSATQFLGLASLRSGPILFFGGSDEGPFAWTPQLPHMPSVVTRPSIAGATPDGYAVVWLDEGAPEPMARLIGVSFDEDAPGATFYASYRLGAAPAGPEFDPSGDWLYLPLPRLDQLDVVQ